MRGAAEEGAGQGLRLSARTVVHIGPLQLCDFLFFLESIPDLKSKLT